MAGAKQPRKKKAAPGAADEALRQREADELRRGAEQRIDKLAAAAAAASPPLPAAEELTAAVHELRVHQIELEMQNEELRRAQLELDAQREKYFELFDMAPVGYLTLSDKGVVGDANFTAAHLLGVERQLLLGQPFSAFVVAADQDEFYLHQRMLQKTGEPQTCELRLVRMNGGGAGGEAAPAHFWAHLEGRAQHETDGRPPSCWVTFTDVDASKRAAEALRESEDRQVQILEHGGIGVAYWGLDGRLLMINRRAIQNMGGGEAADFVGKSYTELFGEEVGSVYTARIHEVAASAEPLEFLDRAEMPGGTRWFSSVHTRVLDAGGSVVGVNVFAHDVTELKSAERRSALLLDSMVEGLALHEIVLDQDGKPCDYRFLQANPAFEEMTGLKAADIIGRTVLAILPGTESSWIERYGAVAQTGAAARFEDYASTLGRYYGVVAYSPQVGQFVTLVSDITERKAAEQEIKRLNAELEDRVLARTAELASANRELEAFVYSASHDLRAPLRSIDGFSQMVVEDAGERLDATDVDHLQRVRAAAQRMAHLIDGLLVLSRASRQEVLRKNVDVSAMARSVIADLRSEHPERRVEVVIQPDLTADADATLLHVILTNLLGNAWKFTAKHETARIEVGVTDGGGERAFFVKDDGAGFDMAAAQHLFGAFQRMHSADEFEGDGIGLATVQRLVARHGGRVWAEAEVEKGATFYFTLPVALGEG
jgi:PAS domain S-box-containing protein